MQMTLIYIDILGQKSDSESAILRCGSASNA